MSERSKTMAKLERALTTGQMEQAVYIYDPPISAKPQLVPFMRPDPRRRIYVQSLHSVLYLVQVTRLGGGSYAAPLEEERLPDLSAVYAWLRERQFPLDWGWQWVDEEGEFHPLVTPWQPESVEHD